jgi:hypothetical protein
MFSKNSSRNSKKPNRRGNAQWLDKNPSEIADVNRLRTEAEELLGVKAKNKD